MQTSYRTCSHLSSSRKENEKNIFSAKNSNTREILCVAFLIARLDADTGAEINLSI
jgi:hypothetical protein